MNKRLTALLLALMMATACGNSQLKDNPAGNKGKLEEAYLDKVEYSNISDDQTIQAVKKLMTDAGISPQRQAVFFDSVKLFNDAVKKEHLTTGYEVVKLGESKYNPFELQKEWTEKYPVFAGYNCRITSFGLFRDFMDLDKNAPKQESWILTDLVSLNDDPHQVIKDNDLEEFKVLFSAIATENTGDINVHLKNVQADWKARNIHFKDKGKVSLITVFFHDDLLDQNNVFIGHTGILIQKSANELYFVEKVAFQEPYQIIKFKNRSQLNDYLMNKYDVEWGQTSAKAFIMENDQLLEGYRPNPKNTGEKRES